MVREGDFPRVRDCAGSRLPEGKQWCGKQTSRGSPCFSYGTPPSAPLRPPLRQLIVRLKPPPRAGKDAQPCKVIHDRDLVHYARRSRGRDLALRARLRVRDAPQERAWRGSASSAQVKRAVGIVRSKGLRSASSLAPTAAGIIPNRGGGSSGSSLAPTAFGQVHVEECAKNQFLSASRSHFEEKVSSKSVSAVGPLWNRWWRVGRRTLVVGRQ